PACATPILHSFPTRRSSDLAPLRPITIGIRIEVRFKDWLQQQLGGCLHHPIPYSRNTEWPFAAAGLRDHHPPHGLWLIRLCAKVDRKSTRLNSSHRTISYAV